MAHALTDAEWDELVDLIAASRARRMGEALKRMAVMHPSSTVAPNPPGRGLHTAEDWLLHLATISSGEAFDRALLMQLRRLSLH